MPAHRVAVIGDVGGHLDELRAELRRLGAHAESGRLPEDLTVVQVGDLVHRGPASAEVIQLVDRYLNTQPAQWVQLVGNHEAHYLREPVFHWPERLDARSTRTLRRWWADGLLRVAAWVRDDAGEEFLITHAGLTAEFWRDTLGAPRGAERAASALNGLIGADGGADNPALFRAGAMLRRRRPVGGAGPLWACTATELLPGWLATPLPFSQVHGHDSLFDWRKRRFRVPGDLARLTVLEDEARHETTALDGGRIIGIDPCHSSRPCGRWAAWEPRTRPAQAPTSAQAPPSAQATPPAQAPPGFGGSGIE